MLKKLVVRFPALVLALILSPLSIGCGQTFEDDDFGGVDLLEFFWDTGVNGNPPANYAPTAEAAGWFNGEQAFYYDFGTVAVQNDYPSEDQRVELGINENTRIPKSAPVNPMYFFFDSRGLPLFSTPVREQRTGRFFMPGGLETRNPNPREDADKGVAYPVRARQLYGDARRNNSADYQRPIVDAILDRDDVLENEKRYSGLWEVVKVRAPSGYTPDAIKSWRTLNEAWADGDGDFQIEQTGLVVNCPLIDSRSVVIPNVSAYEQGELRSPQPVIELWYRKKRVECFLVNGWESLGRTIKDSAGLGDDGYELYRFNEDDRRVPVIDVEAEVLGVGKARRLVATAPVGRLYIPRSLLGNQPRFLPYFVTGGALPRRKKDDPPGYRPVRWWWNIDVLDIPDVNAAFNPKSFINEDEKAVPLTDLKFIDASRLSPRLTQGTNTTQLRGMVRNFPLTGKRIYCLDVNLDTPEEEDPCRPLGLRCGWFQEEDQDPFCQARKVRYGDYCAPTIAQCWDRVDKPRMDPEQSDRVRNEGDTVESWFFEGTGLHPMFRDRFDAIGIPDEILKERDVLSAKSRTWVNYRSPGLYFCHGTNEIGHCYLSCDGDNANILQGQTTRVELDVNTNGVISQIGVDLPLDSRCGGERMPGFRCLPITNETVESGGRVCLRDCNAADPVPKNEAICRYPTPMWLSEDRSGPDGWDIAQNTQCLEAGPAGDRFAACIKDVAFEPYE